jgi:hypothetical protein
MARKTTGHRGLHVRSKHAAQVPQPTKESLSVAEAARAVELLLDERLKGRNAGVGHHEAKTRQLSAGADLPAVKGAFFMALDHKTLDHKALDLHDVTKGRKETVIPRTEKKEAPMVNVRRNGRGARHRGARHRGARLRGARLRGAGRRHLGKEVHMAGDHHRVKGAHPKTATDHRAEKGSPMESDRRTVKDAHREDPSDRRGAVRAHHPRDTTRTRADHPAAIAALHQRVHAPTIRWSPRNPKWAKGLLNSMTLR